MVNTRSSAEKPSGAHLALPMLNKASVKTGGTWEVLVWNPIEDKYDYMWQGKPRQGTNFLCDLVSPDDPRCYLQAQFKKTSSNVQKYEQALKTYVNGARFVMSNVGFVDDAKAAYVSCPLKSVVDLSKTKMEACFGAPDSAVQPAPTATVAGSTDLGTNQFFDVTALIQDVKEVRQHDNNRSSFVVNIHDGSLDSETQKVKIMPLRVYFDTSPPTPRSSSAGQPVTTADSKAFLEEHLKSKTAVSFFCISGAQDDQRKFTFRTTKNTCLAKAVGTKAEKLNSDAVLQNLQVDDTVAFELQAARAARDWSKEPAKETRCKLLTQFARNATGVPELDEGETTWQLNWAEATEPSQGQDIKSNDGKRIWFPITLRDESGTIVLYITEQAAVKLANVVDAAEFEQFHAENRLRFPFWTSVKVWRRPTKPSAVQSGLVATSAAESDNTKTHQQTNDFDCFIVDASEQDMRRAPSLSSAMLLPMLGNSTDNVLPAALGMIRKSDHYAMAVQYFTQEVPQELTKAASKLQAGVPMLRPCSRVVALVESTKRSKLSDAGVNGHKLVTHDVVDLLPQFGDVNQKYTLISFCTLDTVTDFKLDPQGRNKNQAALVSVTTVLDAGTDSVAQPVKELVVDNVHLLTAEESGAFKPILFKMLYFAALAGQMSRKREIEWSPDESPAKASTCRALGRSPTGPPLPDYSAP